MQPNSTAHNTTHETTSHAATWPPTRQLVGVHIANGADDGLGQLVLAHLQGAQEVNGACKRVGWGGAGQDEAGWGRHGACVLQVCEHAHAYVCASALGPKYGARQSVTGQRQKYTSTLSL